MKHHQEVAKLAAAIAFAIGSTAAFAASPAATQLPGKGKVVSGAATAGAISSGEQTLTITGNTVIDWGSGSTLNKDAAGGFNVGSDAWLHFSGASGIAVLNIDSSGNASQVMGHVDAGNGSGVDTGTSIFLANKNGIVVGAKGAISTSGNIGLIANEIVDDFTGTGVNYNGTGGDLTVAKGATVDAGGNLLITGGNVINVDLAGLGGTLTLSAGLPSAGAGVFAKSNTGAQLNITGDRSFAHMEKIASAGDISSAGEVTLNGVGVAVAGTFTNNGTLVINDDSVTTTTSTPTTVMFPVPDGSGGFVLEPMPGPPQITTTVTPFYTTFTGALDNESAVTGTGSLTVGALVNNGTFGAAGAAFGAVTTNDGGLTNDGVLYTGAVDVAGELVNGGNLTSNGAIKAGTLGNDGVMNVGGSITTSGDFVNHGSITAPSGSQIQVTDGSLTNAGSLDGFVRLATQSDADFAAGADYAIVNTGSIISGAGLTINANVSARGSDTDNDSIGSFNNTGELYLAAGSNLTVDTQTDLYLGGRLLTGRGADAEVVSKTNMLGNIHLYADRPWQGQGDATVATPLVSRAATDVVGHTVSVMADIYSAGMAIGMSAVNVRAASPDADGYALRVAKGVTVSTPAQLYVGGFNAGDHPNVILQGTLEGNRVSIGYAQEYAVSDVFTGPQGRIVVEGANPAVSFQFTGRVKNAPYTNAGNFRYNYLPIVYGDTASGTLSLYLGPMAYTTHGTDNGLSAVNILVDGGPVSVTQGNAPAYVHDGDSAVTGVANVPNTHLVLQATGDIATVGNFFWPGYVYLGTIGTDADGNALPGTLGYGQISTGGEFNNALPGNVGGASGIHFMTQSPLDLHGPVVTNAGAWVNFATDLLTGYYVNAQSEAPVFFGGSNTGTGAVVNYGELDASMFHTHPVNGSK